MRLIAGKKRLFSPETASKQSSTRKAGLLFEKDQKPASACSTPLYGSLRKAMAFLKPQIHRRSSVDCKPKESAAAVTLIAAEGESTDQHKGLLRVRSREDAMKEYFVADAEARGLQRPATSSKGFESYSQQANSSQSQLLAMNRRYKRKF